MNSALHNLDIHRPMPCLFYPAVKESGASMKEALTDAKRQAEILIQIGKKDSLGAVVRMTELWCEAASFGMEYEIREDDFPRLGQPLCEEAGELLDLAIPAASNGVTRPLIEAVRLAAPHIEKPLIVGVTGPYTISSVLNGSENFMMNCMTDDDTVHEFLDRVTEYLIAYICEYKNAGADAVMIAEPSVAMISPDMLREFSNDALNRIIDAVQDDHFAVIYHNCGSVNRHLEAIAELRAKAFHFGSDVDLTRARACIDESRLVMGNLEPRLFLSESEASIAEKTRQLKAICRPLNNVVLSTGCDLSPAAKAGNIRAFLETCAEK